jgi:hypothetical protein
MLAKQATRTTMTMIAAPTPNAHRVRCAHHLQSPLAREMLAAAVGRIDEAVEVQHPGQREIDADRERRRPPSAGTLRCRSHHDPTDRARRRRCRPPGTSATRAASVAPTAPRR